MNKQHRQISIALQQNAGFSLVEVVMVAALIGIMTAIAVPQLAGQQRLIRSAAISRELMTQIRFARQQAMTQHHSFTCQYNNLTKEIVVIDHNASGPLVLVDPNYPNNFGSSVVVTSTLTGGGLSTTEINYGIPTGLPSAPLADGISKTNLTGGKINITFQPDGSVIDANGNPLDRALFVYNTRLPRETAAAVSIIGSAGRIKLWKYNSASNTYVE